MAGNELLAEIEKEYKKHTWSIIQELFLIDAFILILVGFFIKPYLFGKLVASAITAYVNFKYVEKKLIG